jgi:hypothetical protein
MYRFEQLLKVFNSSLILLHPKSIYSIEIETMLLKQLNREVLLY